MTWNIFGRKNRTESTIRHLEKTLQARDIEVASLQDHIQNLEGEVGLVNSKLVVKQDEERRSKIRSLNDTIRKLERDYVLLNNDNKTLVNRIMAKEYALNRLTGEMRVLAKRLQYFAIEWNKPKGGKKTCRKKNPKAKKKSRK